MISETRRPDTASRYLTKIYHSILVNVNYKFHCRLNWFI